MDNQTRMDILQELQETLDDGMRFVNGLIAFNEGKITAEDFAAECQEIFNESKSVEKSCQSYLIRIVEHLLLFAYGIDKDAHSHLQREIKTFRRELMELLDWGTKNPETTMINKIKRRISIIYILGIRAYKNHDENNPKLKRILDLLPPEECPWTLGNLMDDSIANLIAKLPVLK